MKPSYTPRAAIYLWVAAAVLLLMSVVTLLTDQPIGVVNLAVGLAMGINVATVVMVGEVRKARAS
jgi:hypothetical protein